MLTELVFAFILNSWRDVAKEYPLARTEIRSFEAQESAFSEARTLMCALENKKLLAFDEQWREVARLEIPERCLFGERRTPEFKSLRVRSASIRPTDDMHSWDQKIDIESENRKSHSLYIRQDKKYVGLHSTLGWSAWLERKSGVFRFEYVNPDQQTHFRIKGRGQIHPITGGVKEIASMEALYVRMEGPQVVKSVLFWGAGAGGGRLVSFARSQGLWQKSKDRCLRGKVCEQESFIEVKEKELQRFGQTEAPEFQDYMRRARPLAFMKIDVSDLVPVMAHYR